MQAVVKATPASDDAFVVAGRVFSECSKNYTDTACSSLRAAITYSSKGGLGKRAGAVCARLGECATSLLPGGTAEATCRNLTAKTVSNAEVTLTSGLDLCTMEGIAGGTGVAGTSTSTGEFVSKI
jgi:hypothetical protein